MFCQSCGEKIDDGVRFCMKCGTAVNSVSTQTNPVATPQAGPVQQTNAQSAPLETSPVNAKHSPTKTLLWITGIILIGVQFLINKGIVPYPNDPWPRIIFILTILFVILWIFRMFIYDKITRGK